MKVYIIFGKDYGNGPEIEKVFLQEKNAVAYVVERFNVTADKAIHYMYVEDSVDEPNQEYSNVTWDLGYPFTFKAT